MVCPDIRSDGLKWTLLGEVQARQCLLYRGVLPIMADPDFALPGGAILDYAIAYVSRLSRLSLRSLAAYGPLLRALLWPRQVHACTGCRTYAVGRRARTCRLLPFKF